MNLKCFGSVPTPLAAHSTTNMRDKVWLYGESDFTTDVNKLYHLSMCSFVWTQIQTCQINPQGSYSLTAISDTMLLMHGEKQVDDALSETWVTDLARKTWKQYTGEKDHSRVCHTVHTSINNNVVVVGGNDISDEDITYTATFHVMLEPRSLQQLTMQTIFKHKDVLSWKRLPKKLMTHLGITESE